MPSRRAPPSLELQVFGVPAAIVQGREVALALQRGVALLAYLGFNSGPVPRAHLAALLWPEADEPLGRTRLRRLVYTVETALPLKVIAADDTALWLVPGAVDIDLLRFARFARQAVSAQDFDPALVKEAREWVVRARHPLLQGIAFDSGAFDDWVRSTALEHENLLSRLLERLVDALGRRGEDAAALELAEVLVGLDPFREPSHVLVMQLHALQGHAAGVTAAYMRCAQMLRAEFGIAPGPRTERAYLAMNADLERLSSGPTARPVVRYAPARLGAVAYTVLGSADRTLVISPGFVCHIEIALEHPALRAFVEALARHFKVILFDRRGLGLSERLGATNTPASLAADIAAILDHEDVPSAWLFGSSEGGLGALRLALDAPHRVDGLCLFGSLARGSAAADYPWALPAAAYDVWLQRLVAGWGGPVGIETFAPSEKDDPTSRAWWARLVRHAASPGALGTILAGLRDADLRAELHRVATPTLVMHRRGDRAVRFEAGQHLARHIPGASWCPLEGVDHFWWAGDTAPVLEAILAFSAR
ncbi:MAG: alpha/beta fold hydrolase [Vitreoscilla sp.]